MSQKERSLLVVISRAREKAMTIREASEVMGLSYRQGRRIYKRYVSEGDKGLIHRNRGRPSNGRKPCKLEEIVLTLYREQYWDLGPTLAAEKLVEEDGEEIHPSSGSPLEKIQPPTSTYQSSITLMKSPEDISNELK